MRFIVGVILRVRVFFFFTLKLILPVNTNRNKSKGGITDLLRLSLAALSGHPIHAHRGRQMYPMPTMRAIDPPACTFNDRDDKSHGTERTRER